MYTITKNTALKKIGNERSTIVLLKNLIIVIALIAMILLKVSLFMIIPFFIISFLSLRADLAIINEIVKHTGRPIVTFGPSVGNNSLEEIGKLYISESIVLGITKKEIIENNMKAFSETMGVTKDDVWRIYGQVIIQVGESLQKKYQKPGF
mgnify:FL=1